MQHQGFAIGQFDLVDHRWRGGDEIEIEFSGETLLDDLEVQKPQEPAAEAKAQRCRGFHFEREAGIVETQLAHGRAQFVEVRGIDREETTEHHRLGRAEVGQRLGRRLSIVGDGVADIGIGDFLDRGGEDAKLAGREFTHFHQLGGLHGDTVELIDSARGHHADTLALLHHPIDDADQNHDAKIGIVPAVDEKRLERRIDITLGRWEARHDCLKHLVDAQASLGGDLHGVGGIDANDILDLRLDARNVGSRQVDLVEHRHDLVIGIQRVIDVGEGLRLDALGRIYDQERAFHGGHGAGDFIGEVDVTGRVDEVEHVVLAVLRFIIEPNGLGLDGNAALALDIHRVEDLFLHLTQVEPACQLDQAVGERGFAMVDMGDYGKIADILERRGHGALIAEAEEARKMVSTALNATQHASVALWTSCARPSSSPPVSSCSLCLSPLGRRRIF